MGAHGYSFAVDLAGVMHPLLMGIDYLDPDWLLNEFGGAFIHDAPGDSYGLELTFRF